MIKFAKFGVTLLFALLLVLSVSGPSLAAQTVVRDSGGLFTPDAGSRLQRFGEAMRVPVVVITSSTFGDSKDKFISQVEGSLPSDGVLVAANSLEGSRFFVVLHGSKSGLSNSDDQRAYNEGVQYLRASGGPNYVAAIFASLYSYDAALGGQASDAFGLGGSAGSGFVATGGGNPPPVSGGSSGNSGSNPPAPTPVAQSGGGLGDLIGGLFGNILCCVAIVIIIIVAIGFSLFSSGKRAVQRKNNYGGNSGNSGSGGNSGGGLGGFFGGLGGSSGGGTSGGFFGGNSGTSGSNSGGTSGGYRRRDDNPPNDPTSASFGGTAAPPPPPPSNAGGGTFESPFGSSTPPPTIASSNDDNTRNNRNNRPTRRDGEAFLGDVFDDRNTHPQDSEDNRRKRKNADEDF